MKLIEAFGYYSKRPVRINIARLTKLLVTNKIDVWGYPYLHRSFHIFMVYCKTIRVPRVHGRFSLYCFEPFLLTHFNLNIYSC